MARGLLLLLALFSLLRPAGAGCTNEGPEVGWIFGTRQHTQIPGVGDYRFINPLMVALGCPNELYNRTGGGLHFCTDCEVPYPSSATAAGDHHLINDGCAQCLPTQEQVLTCGLGPNWYYCDVKTHPALFTALQSGCENPTGKCTFWRSAIEAAGCTMPFDCGGINPPTNDPHGGNEGAGASAMPLVAVVASCSAQVQVPTCARRSTDDGPGSYGATDRTAWVSTHREYAKDVVGSVNTHPNSRVMQGVF